MLNAYEFERHAGCKTKHPNNHIYFESGKTIYQIVQDLKSTPESQLFDAVQTVTGSPINQKSFRIWKGKSDLLYLLVSFILSVDGVQVLCHKCVLVVLPYSLSSNFFLPQNHFKQRLVSFNEFMERKCVIYSRFLRLSTCEICSSL